MSYHEVEWLNDIITCQPTKCAEFCSALPMKKMTPTGAKQVSSDTGYVGTGTELPLHSLRDNLQVENRNYNIIDEVQSSQGASI